MMKNLSLSLSLALAFGLAAPAMAEYESPKTYAQDKLLNAEAQLNRLEEQKNALVKMIKAVKKDLKAAKLRAKAERIQSKADVIRNDATTFVEQSGIAIDLPDLMYSSGVSAELADSTTPNPESTDLMFKDPNQQSKSAAFYPDSSEPAGIENDVVLPPSVRDLK